MVDVGAFNKGLFEENGGKLLCIFSSTRSRVIKDLADNSETVHDFYANYEILQQAVASRLAENDSSREVYIIVDAPNGITPVSLPLLKKADLILMFYRHSVQHVQGTVETAKKVRYYLLPEIGRRFVRIILVGSCVPEDLILGLRSMAGGGMENLAPDAREMLKKFRAIEGRLLKIKSTYAEVVSLLSEGEEGYIVEDEVLKFLEQPLIKADLLRQDLGHATDPEIPVSKNTRHKIELIARCVQDYAAAVLRRKYPHSR